MILSDSVRLAHIAVRAICAAVFLAGAAMPPRAMGQCTSGWLPGDGYPGLPSSYVYTSTMWDPDGPGPLQPRLVAAGWLNSLSFTPISTGAAQMDPVTGSWSQLGAIPSFLETGPKALAAGSNGELYIGGDINGGIQRWNGTAWVVMGAGFNGSVYAITIMNDGSVVAGGNFTLSGGTSVNHVARWNGTTWTAMGAGVGGGFPERVWSLLTLASGEVLAGTNGVLPGGGSSGIAWWNGGNWIPMGGGLFGGRVLSLTQAPGGGDIYASGEFTFAGGVPANFIARTTSNLFSGVWFPLGAGLNGGGAAVRILPNGHVLAGGYFTSAGGQPALYVADWNPANSTWAPLSSGTDQPILTLTRLPNGNIAAGGRYMEFAGGNVAEGVAQWNPSTSQWSAVTPGMNYVNQNNSVDTEVNALLTAQSGDVLAGGNFLHAGTMNAGRLASFNGTNWNASGAGMNDRIRAIAQRPNGDFIVGGDFTAADGQLRSRIARWNGLGFVDMDGGISTFLNPTPNVRAIITLPNNDVIVGGEFLATGGGFAYNIAKWSNAGWSSFDLGTDAPVGALLAMPNGDLIVGGEFQNVGGGLNISAPHIARWNGAAWSPIGGGVDGPVHALALKPNGEIVVGGQFTAAGGAPFYNNIASWNGAVWIPLSSGTNSTVKALAVRANGDVIAGGEFTTAGGLGVAAIARWTGAGWTTMGTGLQAPFNNTSPAVHSLSMLSNGDIAVGGSFGIAGGAPSAYFARYRFGAASPVFATQPVGGQVCYHGTKVLSVSLVPGDYGTVSYQWWRYIPSAPIYAHVPIGTLPSGAVATGSQSPTLTISNFQADDAGQYYCMVTGTCGIEPSSVATLVYCGGDFNCDGSVDFFDYLDFVDAFSLGAPNADFNGDGFIDFFDYLDFVDAFSLGC